MDYPEDNNPVRGAASIDPAKDIQMIFETDIPDGRHALMQSHENLQRVAMYCEDNYIQAYDKTAALADTKRYTTQSLASVAYQINTLATNLLSILSLQNEQLSTMGDQINHIAMHVSTHKEKVARREIGQITMSKMVMRTNKVVSNGLPQEKPVKHFKLPRLDYSVLDGLGHGLHVEAGVQRQHSGSLAGSGSSGSSLNRVSQSSSTGSTLRRASQPMVAPPTVPAEYMPGSIALRSKRDRQSAPSGPAPLAPSGPAPLAPSGGAHGRYSYRTTSPGVRDSDSLCSSEMSNTSSVDAGSHNIIVGGQRFYRNPSSVEADPQIQVGNRHNQIGNQHNHIGGRDSNHIVNLRNQIGSGDNQVGNQRPHVGNQRPHVGNQLPPGDAAQDRNHRYSQPQSHAVSNHLPAPHRPPDSLPVPSTTGPVLYYPGAASARDSFISPPDLPPFPLPFELPPAAADPLPPPPVSPHSPGVANSLPAARFIENVVTLYEYQPQRDDELSFAPGQRIHVIRKNDDGWWEGVLDGVTGLFPNNYVQSESDYRLAS